MKKSVQSWVTIPGIAFFEHKKAIPFRRSKKEIPTIRVEKEKKYQTMDGFGFTLTGVSAELISKLPAQKRKALLRELFMQTGINISVLRLSIGASDLSSSVFTYDDMPAFNLMTGDKEVIPLLKEILKISPSIKIIATPWTAPRWMKTNNSFIGGHLAPKYYDMYARYFVKYILAMKNEGIEIYAVTPQNEPLHDGNEPSMIMTASEQIEFVKVLGPTFCTAGIKTKIFCWDHNCDRPDYPIRVFLDKEASQYVVGSAWHKYGGDIDVLQSLHEMFPEKEIWFTEQWTGKNGDFAGDLAWHAREIDIGAPKRWANAVLKWNLASDPDCSGHTPKGSSESLGAITIDANGIIERKVGYYLVGHSSKFVPPCSVRVESNLIDGLPNVAYETPEGNIVLLVLNDGKERRTFSLEDGDNQAEIILEAGALATYIW